MTTKNKKGVYSKTFINFMRAKNQQMKNCKAWDIWDAYASPSDSKYHAFRALQRASTTGDVAILSHNCQTFTAAYFTDIDGVRFFNFDTALSHYEIESDLLAD